MFTVKEVSELMGISPHSLRFYDKEGLLPTLRRSKGGMRLFSYEDLEWVYNIQCWRATGMPLAEIRRYIELARKGEKTVEQRYRMILQQRERAVEEARAARERVKLMERKLKWYEALMRGENPDKWRPNMQALVHKARTEKKAISAADAKRCAG